MGEYRQEKPPFDNRGLMLMMLERLIDHMRHHDGVRFVTLNTVYQEFKQQHPQPF